MSLPFEQVVRSEITRVTGISCDGKTRVKIRCPFHSDTHPSLYVTVSGKYVGGFNCFACGASSKNLGGWDALADKLGMAKKDPDGFAYVGERRAQKIPAKKLFGSAQEDVTATDELHEGLTTAQLMSGFVPRTVEKWRAVRPKDKWRGFEGPLLLLLKAWKGLDTHNMPCTILPVHIHGELIGGIKCKDVPDGPKDGFKYINMEGPWTRTVGVFAFDLACAIMDASQSRDLFICEGPRSAMALLRLGVAAVAILGVHNWSDQKAHLLLGLSPDRVFTAFDGDDAGRKANVRVLPVFKGYAWRKRIDLPDKQDPFDMGDAFWLDFISQYNIQPVDLTALTV